MGLFLIILLAVFFALNMGGASFAASFAASYGGGALKKKQAVLLFILFVLLGAVLLGQNVANTLGRGIMPAGLIGHKEVLVIFFAAGASMFIANLTKIPQSTSLVTVAAIAGVGFAHQHLYVDTLLYLLPFWVLLPVLSYGLTLLITSVVYPPRRSNFWVYEKVVNQRPYLLKFVVAANCYNAFSVGTNNVANVAGPLMDVSQLPLVSLLFVFALFYGGGSLIFNAPMKTAAKDIVPLGLFTASIISFVSGTLMIIASWLGVPQSFVMLKMGAIFAVATLKHGAGSTFKNPLTQRTLYTWTINPLVTFLVSYLIAKWLI